MTAFDLPLLQAPHLHQDLGMLHAILVVAGWLVYVVFSRGDRQRRPPSAAMAWVLGLFAFPYIALPLYLLLGARKLRRGETPIAWPLATAGANDRLPEWVQHFTHGFPLPACRDNLEIRLSSEGPESLQDFIDAIAEARASIDLSIFIFELDSAGHRVLQALKDAVERGVRVRLLLDQVGNWPRRRALRLALNGTGIDWHWFNPVTLRSLFGRGNLRSHRKYAVIDQRKFWSGGRNLGDTYFEVPDEGGWDDLTFLISGELATDGALLFESDWGTHAPVPASPTPAGHGHRAQLLPSGPDFAADIAHDFLVAAIHRADHQVLAATPYFVPTESLQEALVLASRTGIKVTLVVPEHSNHRLADIARARALRELAEAGADVRLLPGMSHAKAVVVDDVIATCGSLNLDSRSLYLNYELNTVFYDAPQVKGLTDYIQGLAADSRPFVPVTPPWYRDLLEGVVRAVAFQL